MPCDPGDFQWIGIHDPSPDELDLIARTFDLHPLAVEDAGEELRLLYVALTRAQCQVVAWWAPSATTPVMPVGPS